MTMPDDLIARLARTPSTTLRLEPYEPEPVCDTHRRWTSARCEKPPGHDDAHTGRDRWAAGTGGATPSSENEMTPDRKTEGSPSLPTGNTV